MSKKEEFEEELARARVEVLDIKSELAKLDQILSRELEPNEAWIET